MPKIECFGGDVFPTGWIIPLLQDGLIGTTAPLITFLLATKSGITVYIVAMCWFWWGICDFGIGLAVDGYMTPYKGPFGAHVPAFMLKAWLIGNMAAEVYAFYLMWSSEMFTYMTTTSKSVPIAEGAHGGMWIAYCAAAAFVMTVGFPVVGMFMNTMFKTLGFPDTNAKGKKA